MVFCSQGLRGIRGLFSLVPVRVVTHGRTNPVRIPPPPHRWSVTPTQAVVIQKRLAPAIICRGTVSKLRLVAGADLAFSTDGSECIAGVVVWDLLERQVIEQHVVRRPVCFPYVPGLLTFRETPAVLKAIRKIGSNPDVFMFDGQGLAHPRRIGFASHTGLLIDRPSIGCAKSLLVGEFAPPGLRRGSTSPLIDGGECVGMAVRTRHRVKPVFVSIGHRVSLAEAVRITLCCFDGYRIPEPTRLADRLVAQARKQPANAVCDMPRP